MIALEYRAEISNPAWLNLTSIGDFETLQTGLDTWLFAGSSAYGGIIAFNLAQGEIAANFGEWTIPSTAGTFRLSEIQIVTQNGLSELVISEIGSSGFATYQIDNLGQLSGYQSLSFAAPEAFTTPQFLSFDTDGTHYIAAGGGAGDQQGLYLNEQPNFSTLTHSDTETDHVKAALGDVSDLISVEIAGATYLISGSNKDSGISSFSISPTGDLELVDTIGIKEGLWLSGLDSLASVTANETQYIVIGATTSNSLSVVRINPMGVLFVTDHVTAQGDLRIDKLNALETFSVGNRGFVIGGGNDDGLSLFEILPDGQLFNHDNIENQLGWSLENIAAIKAETIGNEVQIFASGSTIAGIMQFTLQTENIAASLTGTMGNDTISGTQFDDQIYGGAGNDSLNGDVGDDLLFGGTGQDQLTGGAGVDVFVFEASLDQDSIMDFRLGEDLIDLSRWGSLYTPAPLTIITRADGAEISFGDYSLRIFSDTMNPLSEAELTADIFIF